MREEYPYCELEVFVAGYERGLSYAVSGSAPPDPDEWLAEELASRRLTMYDLTPEGLLLVGMEARFVPREVFDAGVLRALEETT